MKIAGLVQDSIVDGPGLRFVVFTQGCDMHCDGCHNPDTWGLNKGAEMAVEEIKKAMLSNPLTDGLTLSGGEPFIQAADCAGLAVVAREKGMSVWAFSGFTFEEILKKSLSEPAVKGLLELVDVLVDGRFIMGERTLALKWRGSSNQRLIDVAKSLKSGKGVLYAES